MVVKIKPDLQVTAQTRLMSGNDMRTFSSKFVDDLNIHTDEATAKAAGMPGAVAQGLMSYAIAYELLLNAFGPDAVYENGEVEMAFIKPVLEGDSVTAHMQVVGIRRDTSGRSRADVTLWCENQDGAQIAVGTASIETDNIVEFLE